MAALYGGWYRSALTATTATTGGAILAVANPEGQALIITDLVLHITTGSTGAANVDAGIGATATTSADNLIDGSSVATAGAFDNNTDKGTNGKTRQTWSTSQFLTITGSADTTGLVGFAYYRAIRTGAEA